MRILHLSALYPPIVHGGAERFTAALAEEQVKLGHDVGVVTLGQRSEEAHEHNGVLVHRINHGNLFWPPDWSKHSATVRYAHKFFASWNPILRRRVGHIFESFRPDVINSHCMVGFAVDCWEEATQRGIPVVHTLHDFALFCRNSNAFRNGRMCESVCLACRVVEPRRWYSRHISTIVGVSRDVLQRHLSLGFFSHIPPNRRVVIGNMPPIAVRDRPHRPPQTPFTFGFIGRIVPEKGLEVLLDAVGRLPPEGWRLLVAGKAYPPINIESLQARTAKLPVDWLGHVPAEEFYPKIDILVVPSTYADPAPLVILESFANAVPVVGTRIGGISELIDPCRTGWLCAPGDSAELFDILSDRVSAGRSTLPEKAAFFRFQSERTPQRVAERYEAVYRLTINEFFERQLSPHG